MGILSGKKVMCFIALPHHNRFLVPIMDALRQQGMEVVYFTAAAEGAFEITLNQAKLPYRHVMDYATAETRERVTQACRELRPVLQDRLLRKPILQSVPLVIQDKTVRSVVESHYCMERMLEVEKPDLLFALHELNPWGKILGYLSHVHHIPYFTLQEGLYYGDLHYCRFHTDYSTACIVWGEACRETLLQAGCSRDKIFPLGSTHIWDAKKESTERKSILRTRAALGIGAGKKVILFLMSYALFRRIEAERLLRWMEARGDVVAVFKWHPVTEQVTIDRALEGLRESPFVKSVHDFDTYALIGASDICVSMGNSTTGLEALVFGKPLIEVRLPDQPYSYAQQGVAELASGYGDVGEKAEAILSHGLSKERLEKTDKYLAHQFSYQDDGTLGRIVKLVEESLGASREEKRAPLFSPGETRFPCSIVIPVDGSAPEALLATLVAISSHTAFERFEVLMVDCAAQNESSEILRSLSGDVRVIPGEPGWSYAAACNRAVTEAQGKYLVFLKPGLVPESGWLEGLLQAVEQGSHLGVVGGQLLHENGLLLHIGAAFDVNQSPFSIYRFLPPGFSGAARPREFKAVQLPFLASRELFCQLGGFNTALQNRFEDLDFCLRVGQAGLRVLYTPKCRIVQQAASWEPTPEQDQTSRIRFYSRWAGSLWQDDEVYLKQDGLDCDSLSALYRSLAAAVAREAGNPDEFSDPLKPSCPTP